MNLVGVMDGILAQSYLASSRFGGSQEPSLLRACLLLSAALLLNVVSLVQITEATLELDFDLSKELYVGASIVILATISSFAWARRDCVLDKARDSVRPVSALFFVYLLASLAIYVVSIVLMYRAATIS